MKKLFWFAILLLLCFSVVYADLPIGQDIKYEFSLYQYTGTAPQIKTWCLPTNLESLSVALLDSTDTVRVAVAPDSVAPGVYSVTFDGITVADSAGTYYISIYVKDDDGSEYMIVDRVEIFAPLDSSFFESNLFSPLDTANAIAGLLIGWKVANAFSADCDTTFIVSSDNSDTMAAVLYWHIGGEAKDTPDTSYAITWGE